MFMVTTTDGVRADTGQDKGLSEQQAQASAKDRNDRAAQLGVKARYEVVPFEAKA